ncbi:GapA-binding peptide SR1P [Shouchella lonarensis]|nr:GapA-binding peptide SR1P [Shouchella lonarensis]
MGTIVCQHCDQLMDHFEGEKVSRLYATGVCATCQVKEEEQDAQK